MASTYRPNVRQRSDFMSCFDADEFVRRQRAAPVRSSSNNNNSLESSASVFDVLLLWMLVILAFNLLLRYFIACWAQIQHNWPRFTPLEPSDYWPFKIEEHRALREEEEEEDWETEEDGSDEKDSDEEDSQEEDSEEEEESEEERRVKEGDSVGPDANAWIWY